MANSIKTASVIAKIALPILDNELGVMSTLFRGHESEYSSTVNGYKKGDTVTIMRPADFTVTDGATLSLQDITEGGVTLTIDTQKHVGVPLTSKELSLDMASFTERVVRPAMTNLANKIAEDVFSTFYKGVYNWAGTPGQTINSFTDFAKGPERLDEMAVPQDSRNAALSPADYWALVGSNTALFTNDAVTKSLRRGELGMLGNVSTWMSQVMPTHTVGVATGTPLVNGASQNVTYETAKDSWSQTLNTDGWTNSTTGILKAGDVITIAGVNMVNPKTKADTGIAQQFVVQADADSGATTGPATLTISPPIITSGPHQTVTAAPADNAAITVMGTGGSSYKQNLVYHKNAMALAVVPLETDIGAVDVARQTRNGLSVRVLKDYDVTNDRTIWRFDVLYGKKLIDPRLVTRLSGTA